MREFGLGLCLVLGVALKVLGQNTVSSSVSYDEKVWRFNFEPSGKAWYDECLPGVFILEEERQQLILNDEVLSSIGLEDNTKIFGIQKRLYVADTIPVGSVRFKTIFSSLAVDQVLFLLHDTEKGWMIKKFDALPNEGTQKKTGSLASWSSENSLWLDKNDTLIIDSIGIAYSVIDDEAKSRVQINDFSISLHVRHEEGKVLPWLDSLVGNYQTHSSIFEEYAQWGNQLLETGSCFPPTFDVFASQHGYLSGLIKFGGIQGNADRARLLKQLVAKHLAMYPFYEERRLDKPSIQKDFRKLCSQNMEYMALVEAIAAFIKFQIGDPHFYLYTGPNRNNLLGRWPILLTEVAGNIVVGAVFHSDLTESIPIGSVVLGINGHEIRELGSEYKLVMDEHNSIVLDIEGIDCEPVSITVDRVDRIQIPQGFRALHGDAKYIADSVFYLRFNNWAGDSYYFLINYFSQIVNSKGLILDLRSNGGGFGSDVIKSLSLFVKETKMLVNIKYPWFTESSMVRPHATIHFPEDLKLVILVDGRTACSSEMFIHGLQARPNTIVIGSESTLGALASPTTYVLDTDLRLVGHSVIREFSMPGFMEGEGIAPDVYVSQTHANDLRPYNDKILKIATLILHSYESQN